VNDDNGRNNEQSSVTLIMSLLNHAADWDLIRVRSIVNMQVPVLSSQSRCRSAQLSLAV